MIYLAESAPLNKCGFNTSFAAIGANLGFLLATVTLMLLHFFSKEAITDWAWRLPFLLIGLPGSLIIYYRFKLSESPVYLQLQKKNHIEPIPFIAAITLITATTLLSNNQSLEPLPNPKHSRMLMNLQ